MPDLPEEAVQAAPAELIEAALREHMRLKVTPTTIEHAQRGWPIWMSGGEAANAAEIARKALDDAGLVVVPAEDLQAAHHMLRQEDLLARLGNMLADLDGHIERRAAEVAQPLIAEAREAAITDVERAQHEQQRAEDLAAELRRQLAVQERYNQSYRGRAAAVRALHPPVTHENRAWCKNCSENDYPMYQVPYPCPTIRALDSVAAQRQETGRG